MNSKESKVNSKDFEKSHLTFRFSWETASASMGKFEPVRRIGKITQS